MLFCLFDEVDVLFDDVNIEWFVNFVCVMFDKM